MRMINSNLNKICDKMNCNNAFKYETEEVIERMILPVKKRYLARVCFDKTTGKYVNDVYIEKGMEFKKSNISAPIKEILRNLTVEIMDKIGEEELMDKLRDLYYELPKMPMNDIAWYQSAKNLKKYKELSKIEIIDLKTKKFNIQWVKGCPYHVKGVLATNELILNDKNLHDLPTIIESSKSAFYFVKENNPFGVKVAAVSDKWHPKLYEYFEFDYDYMFERLIFGPLRGCIRTIGYNFELTDILGYKNLGSSGQAQYSLF